VLSAEDQSGRHYNVLLRVVYYAPASHRARREVCGGWRCVLVDIAPKRCSLPLPDCDTGEGPEQLAVYELMLMNPTLHGEVHLIEV
jgi:hypothetical protein